MKMGIFGSDDNGKRNIQILMIRNRCRYTRLCIQVCYSNYFRCIIHTSIDVIRPFLYHVFMFGLSYGTGSAIFIFACIICLLLDSTETQPSG